MKVVQINGGVFGSTGKIMHGIKKACTEAGIDVLCASPITSTNRKKEPNFEYKKIGTYWRRRFCSLLDRFSGKHDSHAKKATKKFLKELDKYKPDIIHLHNIHGSFLNIELLFDYINCRNLKLIWTFHDCWPFTGHCAHFDMIACNKWQSHCHSCPILKSYPRTIVDSSSQEFDRKRSLFNGVKNLTIVTPSNWLKQKVGNSFLNSWPCEVINNGIDLSIYKPTKGDFRDKHNLSHKKIILGVSFGWDYAKGLDVFIELSSMIPQEYKIVLVGTDEKVDKLIPDNIISIHRTHDQSELAEIYSAADVFVNPTRQDTFPTVNMESLACGTPVITFKTGGSTEIITPECGIAIDKNDIKALYSAIIKMCDNSNKESCVIECQKQSVKFDEKIAFNKYADLYLKVFSS